MSATNKNKINSNSVNNTLHLPAAQLLSKVRNRTHSAHAQASATALWVSSPYISSPPPLASPLGSPHSARLEAYLPRWCWRPRRPPPGRHARPPRTRWSSISRPWAGICLCRQLLNKRFISGSSEYIRVIYFSNKKTYHTISKMLISLFHWNHTKCRKDKQPSNYALNIFF